MTSVLALFAVVVPIFVLTLRAIEMGRRVRRNSPRSRSCR